MRKSFHLKPILKPLVLITATAQGGTVKNIYKQLGTTALLAATGLPGTLMAESASDSGATPLSAAANLDFEIIIPGILNFQVGTAGGGNIDLISFAPTAANLGNDANLSGTGGDVGSGVVSVELLSNAGQVTITPTNSSGGAGLTNGTENIPYTEILSQSNLPALDAPVLSNAGGTATLPTATAGVTDLSAQWSYFYDNSAVYGAGTYGGINTQGGRVTYTAAIP
jgi:hypothetical protein